MEAELELAEQRGPLKREDILRMEALRMVHETAKDSTVGQILQIANLYARFLIDGEV